MGLPRTGQTQTAYAASKGVVDNGREMLASFGSAHPIGRIGHPREVAEAVAFLCSEAAPERSSPSTVGGPLSE
ncbi:SDR family oxidoreductase [Allokutzneria oryzae]|uniref:SDR family oxidoreductase n=1 Tax=Allokutzneria oryzae TaxID=1378989 RepID=A0ABV5ZYJ6_9PSEU